MTPEKLSEYLNVLAEHGWTIFWAIFGIIILLGMLI